MFIVRTLSLLISCLTIGFSIFSFAQDAPTSSFSNIKAHADTLDAVAILRGETSFTRQQWLRRQLFIENTLTQVVTELSDSTLLFRLQQNLSPGIDKSQLSRIPPRVDMIGERLRREELDAPPLLSFGNLLGAGVKYLAEKLGRSEETAKPFAVIPSELEIDVLKVLWKENQATSSEIYSHLDSVRMTAADLQQTLALMTARGLLEQQQISPRNEFTLLGGITIEMSKRNRKNREYFYRPKISRQTMFAFLDATAFSYRIASANDHSLIVEHLRKLINKLVMTEE